MDILLDTIQHGAVVFQEDTVCLSTAALHGVRLADRGREGL